MPTDLSQYSDEQLLAMRRQMQAEQDLQTGGPTTQPELTPKADKGFFEQTPIKAGVAGLMGAGGGLLAGGPAGAAISGLINAGSALMSPPETTGDWAAMGLGSLMPGASKLAAPAMAKLPGALRMMGAMGQGLAEHELLGTVQGLGSEEGMKVPNPLSAQGAVSAAIPGLSEMYGGFVRTGQAAKRRGVMEKMGLTDESVRKAPTSEMTAETKTALQSHVSSLEKQIDRAKFDLNTAKTNLGMAKANMIGQEGISSENFLKNKAAHDQQVKYQEGIIAKLEAEKARFKLAQDKGLNAQEKVQAQVQDILKDQQSAQQLKVDASDIELQQIENKRADLLAQHNRLGKTIPNAGLSGEVSELDRVYREKLLDKLENKMLGHQSDRGNELLGRMAGRPGQSQVDQAKEGIFGKEDELISAREQLAGLQRKAPKSPRPELIAQGKQDVAGMMSDNIRLKNSLRTLEENFTEFKSQNPSLAKIANMDDHQFIETFFQPSTSATDVQGVMTFLKTRPKDGEKLAGQFRSGMINEIAKRYVSGQKVVESAGQSMPAFGPEKLRALFGSEDKAKMADAVMDAFGKMKGTRGALTEAGKGVGKSVMRALPWLAVMHTADTFSLGSAAAIGGGMAVLSYPALIEHMVDNPRTGRQFLDWARNGATASGLKAYPLVNAVFQKNKQTVTMGELEQMTGEEDRRNRVAKQQQFGIRVPESGQVPIPGITPGQQPPQQQLQVAQ